jgi:hypothetical protein
MKQKIHAVFLPLMLAASTVLLLATSAARADDVTSAQRRAALEYLNAAASGSAQALAFAIHPDELDRLRADLVARLREEGKAGGSALRTRLFGPVVRLQDVERMTSLTFFQTLARGRLAVGGRRPYEEVKGLTAIRDGKILVHVMVKGVQPKDRGATQVVEIVSLLPYGKDWKAAIPGDIEAQIEDLIAGRGPAAARAAAMGASGAAAGTAGGAATEQGGGSSGGAADGTGGAVAGGAGAMPGAAGSGAGVGAGTSPSSGSGATGAAGPRSTPEILAMLSNAEKALLENRCDDYYREYMSPTFRKTLSGKALTTLINGCRNGIAQREVLIAALRIVKKLPPRYEYENSRAVYDVAGQGLPYDQFTVERLDGRWYIAE